VSDSAAASAHSEEQRYSASTASAPRKPISKTNGPVDEWVVAVLVVVEVGIVRAWLCW